MMLATIITLTRPEQIGARMRKESNNGHGISEWTTNKGSRWGQGPGTWYRSVSTGLGQRCRQGRFHGRKEHSSYATNIHDFKGGFDQGKQDSR